MQNAPSPRGLVGLLKMPEINEGVAADAYRSAEVWAPKTASQTDRYGIWYMEMEMESGQHAGKGF